MIFLILVLLGLAAYLYLNPKKALRVIIPDLNAMENLHVTLLQDTALIEARLDIENKGLFKLDIDSLEYRVKMDTATLLSESRYLGLELRRSQKDTIDLPVALPFKRMRKVIREHQGQDSLDLPIEVKLVYGTVFGRKVLRYSKTIRIEVPRPPEFEIEKVEYLRREKKTGFFMIHLKMLNHGKVRLNVSDLHYRFEAPELFSARGREQKMVHIEPRSAITVQLPVQVEFKQVFKLLGRWLGRREVDYQLKVTGLIQVKDGERKIPIEVERRGRMELR